MFAAGGNFGPAMSMESPGRRGDRLLRNGPQVALQAAPAGVQSAAV
jgi:hypothetical protein